MEQGVITKCKTFPQVCESLKVLGVGNAEFPILCRMRVYRHVYFNIEVNSSSLNLKNFGIPGDSRCWVYTNQGSF